MSSVAHIIGEADKAAASGELQKAHALLRQASQDSDDPALLMRLAGVERALGRPGDALASVHRALALQPRDFTSLLMRASLLEQLDSPEAGEAWGHALVQQPEGDPPAHLRAVLDKAKDRFATWSAERDEALARVTAPAEARASEEERGRLQRFRSNTSRRTKVFHSTPTEYHFPNLPEREFHPRRLFPWIEQIEAQTDVIAAELEAVMRAERAELVPYIQYSEHRPLDQWRDLNQNRDWTAIHLLQNGSRVESNAVHCPRTMDILKSCDQPDVKSASPNAMFSLLAPKTAIPAHVGVSNTRLVCHLPLVVPAGCWFRVGEETRFWERGKAFVFDDTIEHEALNPSDELRIVFIFDVWNPELSAVEREGVAALIGTTNAGAAGGL